MNDKELDKQTEEDISILKLKNQVNDMQESLEDIKKFSNAKMFADLPDYMRMPLLDNAFKAGNISAAEYQRQITL